MELVIFTALMWLVVFYFLVVAFCRSKVMPLEVTMQVGLLLLQTFFLGSALYTYLK